MDTLGPAEGVHDLADVGEQAAGERLGHGDRLAVFLARLMAGPLQVEAQGHQPVPHGVVELAGDAQPLGYPAAVGEELAGGPQLGVGPRLAVEGLDGEEDQDLESEIWGDEHQRRPHRPMNRDRDPQQERLSGDPEQARPPGDPGRELHGDQHQERPLEAVAEEEHQDHHARGLESEQGEVEAAGPLPAGGGRPEGGGEEEPGHEPDGEGAGLDLIALQPDRHPHAEPDGEPSPALQPVRRGHGRILRPAQEARIGRKT